MWLLDKVPEMTGDTVAEPEFTDSIVAPVSASAPEVATEPEHSTDQSTEPVQLTTTVPEMPSEFLEHGAPAGDEASVPGGELSVQPVVDSQQEESWDSDDPNARGVRIYTDTTEGVPQVERDVQETEEVLPDGTVVRRQVVTTSQRQTISTRVVMEGPEDVLPASKAEAEQLLGEMGVSEELGRQITTTSMDSEPQASTNVEEHEEILPDGSIVKRRVVTTTKQHVTTERVSLEDDIPTGTRAVLAQPFVASCFVVM